MISEGVWLMRESGWLWWWYWLQTLTSVSDDQDNSVSSLLLLSMKYFQPSSHHIHQRRAPGFILKSVKSILILCKKKVSKEPLTQASEALLKLKQIFYCPRWQSMPLSFIPERLSIQTKPSLRRENKISFQTWRHQLLTVVSEGQNSTIIPGERSITVELILVLCQDIKTGRSRAISQPICRQLTVESGAKLFSWLAFISNNQVQSVLNHKFLSEENRKRFSSCVLWLDLMC